MVKRTKRKTSYKNGSSFLGNHNSSITVSTQKEEIYDANVFAELKQGEFILSAGQSNVKHLRTRFKKFELEEKPLPIIHLTSEKEVIENFEQSRSGCGTDLDGNVWKRKLILND